MVTINPYVRKKSEVEDRTDGTETAIKTAATEREAAIETATSASATATPKAGSTVSTATMVIRSIRSQSQAFLSERDCVVCKAARQNTMAPHRPHHNLCEANMRTNTNHGFVSWRDFVVCKAVHDNRRAPHRPHHNRCPLRA